jgi:hypothetical protein
MPLRGELQTKLKADNSGPRRLGRIVVRIHGVSHSILSLGAAERSSLSALAPGVGSRTRLQSERARGMVRAETGTKR